MHLRDVSDSSNRASSECRFMFVHKLCNCYWRSSATPMTDVMFCNPNKMFMPVRLMKPGGSDGRGVLLLCERKVHTLCWLDSLCATWKIQMAR